MLQLNNLGENFKNTPEFDPYKGKKPGSNKPRIFASVAARKRAFDAYYKEMKTYEQIGEEFGTSKVVVKNLFKVMEWPARNPRARRNLNGRLSKEAFDDYTDLYLLGRSIDSLSKEYKVAPHLISLEIKKRRAFQDRSIRTKEFHGKAAFAYLREEQNLLQIQSPYNGLFTKKQFVSAVYYVSHKISALLIGKPPKFSPDEIGSGKPQLDHIHSVNDAYYLPRSKPLSIWEVSHPVNLQWLTPGQNSTKGKKSGMTVAQLRRKIKVYNETYGDPYEGVKVKSTCLLYGKRGMRKTA